MFKDFPEIEKFYENENTVKFSGRSDIHHILWYQIYKEKDEVKCEELKKQLFIIIQIENSIKNGVNFIPYIEKTLGKFK